MATKIFIHRQNIVKNRRLERRGGRLGLQIFSDRWNATELQSGPYRLQKKGVPVQLWDSYLLQSRGYFQTRRAMSRLNLQEMPAMAEMHENVKDSTPEEIERLLTANKNL